MTNPIAFRKMHGLGNDFVVIDARGAANPVTPEFARRAGDRHFGVGFDQLAVILDSDRAEARLQFWNSDGSLSATCGNASRCVAGLIFAETGRRRITLETDHALLECEDLGGGLFSVNMGHPLDAWAEIPLAEAADTLHLPIAGDPVGVGLGNPHCVFFVDDLSAVDLAARGAEIEHHLLFPMRANVEFVKVISAEEIRARIWERGAGATLASGSCASAAAVAAARRGLTGRKVRVRLDGGVLEIDWRADGVWMSGPTAHVFDGAFTAEFLARAR